MLKPQKYNIEDTNIANLGSELEKQVKKAAAETEDAWKGVGKEVGMWIWRIEKFKVVPWPKEQYGNFFSGDSYILLRTYKKSEDTELLSHDVHFWLGLETTQDEAGTAAYKTVELDDVLGGAPVQHREVQGAESQLFLSYFKTMNIMSGGVETGFKHVEPHKYRARLLIVKGFKENTIVREVPLQAASLNAGDCFILDNGLALYNFNGAQASIPEKLKATTLVKAIADERGGQPTVNTFDQGQEPKEFWDLLGGQAPIAEAASGGDDKAVVSEKRLFRLTDGLEGPAPRPNFNPSPVSHSELAPSLKVSSSFDPAAGAEALKKAIGFFGAKGSVLIEVLATCTYQQRLQLREAYQKLTGKDLLKRLESKTSFNFKKTLLALFADPRVYDAAALRSAIKGAGTDEGLLIEILCNRSNAELKEIKEAYKKEYNRDLDADVASDTSGDFKKFLLEILKANRDESGTVNDQQARDDAEALYKAGEGKWGTDEDKFIEILTHRSRAHLLAVFSKYQESHKNTILKAIHSETSGDFRLGLTNLVRSIISRPEYYQDRLYRAMKGLGTNDETLMRIFVSRAEIDLAAIRKAFDEAHPETLAGMVSGDTSGHYRDLLLRLLGETSPSAPVKVVPKAAGGAGKLPKLSIHEVASGKVTRDMLDSNDVFIFDVGFEVFAWVGKGASKLERKACLQYAQDFLFAYKRPLATPISRILEGGENEVFENSFDH